MNFEIVLRDYALPIAGAFFVAWLIHRLSSRIVGRFVRLGGYAPGRLRPRAERLRTLQDLIASAVSFGGFLAAAIFTVGLFVDATTLVWMIGLFSAAFGLGARPLIADLLTGMGLIVEDTFAVGEKVEILEIEGIIEKINLRTTLMRSPSGELYIIPNGEIRVIRNFSRGSFSTVKIKLKCTVDDMERATSLLETLGEEAVVRMPNVIEPWQVLASGEVGQHTELTIIVRTRFGKAAETRPRLMALIHNHLEEASIEVFE